MKPKTSFSSAILVRRPDRLSALASGATAIWIIGLSIWARGLPWNSYWWLVLAAFFLVALCLPLIFNPPARLLPRFILACLVVSSAALPISYALRHVQASVPSQAVFSVDAAYPTKDKPQSKLWFAHKAWWAWLPDGKGSSLWRRDAAGWKRQVNLDTWLEQVPGRADIWHGRDGVRAVLVSRQQLTVAGLKYDPEAGQYRPAGRPMIRPIANPKGLEEPIESATIARDGRGTWWIAYDYDSAIWVIHSLDEAASSWSAPLRIGGPVVYDDIAVSFAARGSIGVMWGHQSGGPEEQVFFRSHLDAKPPEDWEETEIVAQGYEAAEDHFNVAIDHDGWVYIVTKDDQNIIDQPQLVLRRLSPDGTWDNLGYAERHQQAMPTRPIALIGGQPDRLFLVHSLYPQNIETREDYIVYRSSDLALSELHGADRVLIPPVEGRNIRNATSTKQRLPDGAPWIVLASDGQGNVYEGTIWGPEFIAPVIAEFLVPGQEPTAAR